MASAAVLRPRPFFVPEGGRVVKVARAAPCHAERGMATSARAALHPPRRNSDGPHTIRTTGRRGREPAAGGVRRPSRQRGGGGGGRALACAATKRRARSALRHALRPLRGSTARGA